MLWSDRSPAAAQTRLGRLLVAKRTRLDQLPVEKQTRSDRLLADVPICFPKKNLGRKSSLLENKLDAVGSPNLVRPFRSQGRNPGE
jgi:hypothetical protein